MKKIAICVVLLFCLGAGSLFAQDVLSWPEPISPVHPIINLGVGFGGIWGYGIDIPPLVGSVDIPVDLPVPLSFGLGVGYAQFGSGFLKVLNIGARVALHLNFGVRGLDVYPVLALGPTMLWWDAETMWGITIMPAYSATVFGFGFAAGMRYFFNDNIGVWAEAGYSNLTYISGGLTFTFGGGGGSSSSSSSGRYMYVNADSLNVRSGPSADNALVGTLVRGASVEVLDKSGTWWKIKSGNIQGYVNSSYLKEK